MPVLRLADHLDTEIGPSDEEGGKEAKRQKSEPTTPISTSNRPPNEYDEVMGITQMDSREVERFDEGLDRNSKTLRKDHQTSQPASRIQDMCRVLPTGVMAVHHYKNV